MENWMLVSLYVIQTLVGAIIWRKHEEKASTLEILGVSCLVIMNILGLIYILSKSVQYLVKQLCNLIDFLAGKSYERYNL